MTCNLVGQMRIATAPTGNADFDCEDGASWGVLGASQRLLGASWGASWGLLGVSLGPLGAPRGVSGRSWGHFGRFLSYNIRALFLNATWKRLGAVLGPSWGRLGALLGPSWGLLRPSWSLLQPSWGLLGAFWGHLKSILGVLRRISSTCCKNATPPTRNAHSCRQDGAKMLPSWAQVEVKPRT